MIELALIVGGFFLGSIPFALLIGRYGFGKDVREYGDGNPGTFNVIRAGGWKWGGLALLLDMSKGAITVGLARFVFGIDSIILIPIAMAPILGHAYSPFLKFNGGKAIATSGGVWIGLTLWEIPVVGMIFLVYWYLAVTISGWAVMLMLASVLVYMLLVGKSVILILTMLVNIAFLAWKHREDLAQPLRLKMSPLFRRFFPNLEFERS